MLHVGVHRSEHFSIGVLPAMQHGSGKTRLPFADEQSHARVLFGDRRDNLSRSIAAIIIDNEYLILQTEPIERLAHSQQ